MPQPPRIRTLDWQADPLEIQRRWPADRPLQMLHTHGPHERWGRWSILAMPAATYRLPAAGPPILDGRLDWPSLGRGPVHDIDALCAMTRREPTPLPIPFAGGWIAVLSYDLGRLIEPACALARGAVDDRGWPVLDMLWCPDALVCDRRTGAWWAVGSPDLAALGPDRPGAPPEPPPPAITSRTSREDYLGLVRRALDYIAAGDVFQVNLTQRLSMAWRGCPRRLARHALRASDARYGAALELPGGRHVISMSPELFLEVGADGWVTTRPIKGTRPSHATVDELRRSEKDRAELHMIVDLMRNDLGRVCEFGSITVPCGRSIESHPTVHHGVGEVRGRLRDDVSLGSLIAATFPGGSVTGAPKIRAMQIIDELEPVRRGPYCGAIGFASDHGGATFNIAIRTLALTPSDQGAGGPFDGTLDYGAGGGIVADSSPALEYRESLDKAEILHRVIDGMTDMAIEQA
ncbi:MAG: anthranilate synthase component I family protein [Planctomycetota bacterium]|jgi:anthranilate/para-aminobenzoate synthase component I